MKPFEVPTISIEAVLRDTIASSDPGSDIPGVSLPEDPNY